MNKRIISAVLSLAVTSLSVFSQTANAMVPADFAPEKFSDCIKIEDTDGNRLFHRKYEALYMRPNDHHGATFYFVESSPDIISFSVSKEMDENVLEQIIKDVDPHLILSYWKNTTNDYYNCNITLKNDEDQYDKISSKTAKELYKSLSDYAYTFDYMYDRYVYTYGVYDYLTGYEVMDHSFPIEERLNDYLESNDISASLIKYSKGDTDLTGKEVFSDKLFIVPDNGISVMEHYELAKSIAAETDIMPHGVGPTGVGGKTEGKTIDVVGSTDGDSNCDGKMDLADAIFIMQSLANPDKYQLSAQGRFNGDIDSDGITSGDALEIQERLLGLK